MKYDSNSAGGSINPYSGSDRSMVSGYQQQGPPAPGNPAPPGTVSIDAYGVSDCGFSGRANTDNVYINGIYMKSFKYSHFSKGVYCAENNALFAVCHNCDDAGGKQFLYNLDKEKIGLYRSGIKSTNNFFDYMTCKNNLTRSRNMELAALYISEYGASAYAIGGSKIYFCRGGKAVDISCSNVMQNIYVGCEHGGISKAKPIMSADAEGVYVICTSVVARTLAADTILSIALSRPPKEAAKEIAAKTASMIGGSDGSVSCIVVRPEFRKKHGVPKAVRRALIAAAGALTAFLLIFGIAFGVQAHECAAYFTENIKRHCRAPDDTAAPVFEILGRGGDFVGI